jgi:RNase P subunit RPR2
MARIQARPRASQEVILEPIQITCRGCGSRMRMARHSRAAGHDLAGHTDS